MNPKQYTRALIVALAIASAAGCQHYETVRIAVKTLADQPVANATVQVDYPFPARLVEHAPSRSEPCRTDEHGEVTVRVAREKSSMVLVSSSMFPTQQFSLRHHAEDEIEVGTWKHAGAVEGQDEIIRIQILEID